MSVYRTPWGCGCLAWLAGARRRRERRRRGAHRKGKILSAVGIALHDRGGNARHGAGREKRRRRWRGRRRWECAGLLIKVRGAPFGLGVPVVVAENEVARVVEGYVRAKEVSCCFVLTLPSGQPGCPKGEAAREKDEEGCDYTYGRCWRRVGGRRSGDHEITGRRMTKPVTSSQTFIFCIFSGQGRRAKPLSRTFPMKGLPAYLDCFPPNLTSTYHSTPHDDGMALDVCGVGDADDPVFAHGKHCGPRSQPMHNTCLPALRPCRW